MKIQKPILFSLIAFLFAFSRVTAQDIVKVKPEINYSASPVEYVIGGVTLSGADEYDASTLQSFSGLTVGQHVTIPQSDNAITNAIRRFWAQKLFSDVKIEADSIVGNKIYLHITLAPLPRLSKIIYSGMKKSEREDLEKQMGLKEGNQVSTNTIDIANAIVRKYYDEKGFKNAKIELLRKDDPDHPNHLILTLNVDKNEKVKVHKIYFSGVDGKQAKQLKRAMAKTKEVRRFRNIFKSKKFIDEKYMADKDNLIEKFNEWGYRDAYITHDTIRQFDDKHVDVYIDVDKGEKYFVRNISWVGNTVYTTAALNRTLQLKRGDVYNQKLLEDRIKNDDDAIANEYYNNGYVFNEVVPVETNVVGDSIDLEIRIIERRQAHLNHVNITGNESVFDEVVRRELKTKPGDLFSRDAIIRSARELTYMGHFEPEKVEPDPKPNPEDGTVDVTYKLVSKSNDQFEISGGWGPAGLTGRVGVKFTNFAVQNFLKKDGKVRNVFPQGLGQTIELSAQTNGTYYQQYSFSFIDPWFGRRRPNQLSLSLFYSKQTDVNSRYYNSSYYNNYWNYMYGYGTSESYYNYANYYDPDKYIKVVGGSIGWGKRLRWPDDYFTFSASLTYQRYMLRNWQYFFVMTDGDCNNLNLTLNFNRISSDQQFYPSRGSDFALSVSATPPFSLWDGKNYAALGNNSRSASYQREVKEKYRWVEYHKWKFLFKSYTALNGAMKTPVLMTRTEFGLLGYYNRHKPSPFETFYVGGDGMSGYSTGFATETIGLRGYDNGSLTPYGYDGYAYSRMTFELRYPLMLGATGIYALTFAEGGNAWTSCKKFNPFDMKRSLGAGIRIMLPMIGMMGIDWAYGFDKVFGSKGGSQFHFIIGQEF
ncbi:MAG: outer membrane protein assembly factor BamA [Bacteroidaceae bacterium]|nr:outer membrane protein assembly factor BamA [Bacteroidaceae bacterium]